MCPCDALTGSFGKAFLIPASFVTSVRFLHLLAVSCSLVSSRLALTMLVEAPLSPSISSLNVTDIISQIRFYCDKGLPNYPVAKIAPRLPNSVCFYKAEKRLAQ